MAYVWDVRTCSSRRSICASEDVMRCSSQASGVGWVGVEVSAMLVDDLVVMCPDARCRTRKRSGLSQFKLSSLWR